MQNAVKTWRFYLLAVLLGMGCNKGIHVHKIKNYPPIEENQGFVVFQSSEQVPLDGAELVGIIDIKRGYAVGCESLIVLDFAKSKARSMGANILKIVGTGSPDIWVDPCFKLKAEAYRLPDISHFEKEIIWHKQRKLAIRDFKGSTENRPFQAATLSGHNAWFWKVPYQQYGILKVEAYLDCHKSYFKSDADSIATLAHEQVHFDISELYARKILQRVQQEVSNYKDLQLKMPIIMDDTSGEMQLLNDKYDSEVYADPSKLQAWIKNIAAEIEKLSAFESKQVKTKS